MNAIPGKRRHLVVCAAATVAFAAALVAAIGPAEAESAEYTWPPPTVLAETPRRGWFTPLPLLNRVPDSLELRIPCGLAPPLGDEGRPATVIATARSPSASEALRVGLDEDSLTFAVGGRTAARVPWPAGCPRRFEIEDGELRLPQRTVELRSAALDGMPVVTGLFSGLDLAAGAAPEIVVRTRTYATDYSTVQTVAAVLALVLALAALILVARVEGRAPGPPLRRRLGSAWAALDATDLVVVGSLLVWWIVAPVHFDDGWLWVTSHVFDDLGAIGSYFDNWGANSPLGYWLEWLRHWVVGSTQDLVVARVPSLVALLVAWALCRWTLNRGVETPPVAVIRWTLAGAFLVGATAWGMTLRQEPFVVPLAATSLAAAVSFSRAPRPAPLAIGAISAVLAATAHPAGIVAAAPLLALVPELLRWLRRGDRRVLLALGTLALAASAVTLVVFTLDADLGTRLGDARVVGEGEFHGEPWWKEYLRYERFDGSGGATAVRRLGLALLLLSVLAWLTRRRVAHTAVLLLPARSVAVALLLLSLVASKWAAHFGTLAVVGAVAVAAELARLLDEGHAPGLRWIRLVLAGAVLAAVAVWCWRAPGLWSSLDLQETEWNDGFGVKGYGWMVIAAVLAAVLGIRALSRPSSGRRWSLAGIVGWALPALSLAAVGVTIGLLALDAARAPWTPARQNLEALSGGESCGLAHQLDGEPDVVERLSDPAARSFLDPPVALYVPCATPASVDGGLVEIPGFVVHQGGLWPQERDGPLGALPDLYATRVVASGPLGIEILAVSSGEVSGYGRVDAVRSR